MIGHLTGKLLEKQPPQLVIDVAGVGYEVDAPMSTIYVLPHVGDAVSLFTHMVVREDAQLLYGFATRTERDLFRALIKITGIGAKIALAILSGLQADELAVAIATEDTARLARVPGIGKKTAERLVLELKGKIGSMPAATGGLKLAAPEVTGGRGDVLHALLALGYNEKEAAHAMKDMAADIDVSQGIKLALKQLARA